ncbi:MAG: hypothetical protein CMH62_00850 [Nanoarchaeota archaeon]|jgi:hypothetical protein|nr:hypothetical protein [Nanoarchaeota archaeon]|tara:strand:- start:388 stop:813 length:426 start_codon:yes stop_codon:yes gene_type:complete
MINKNFLRLAERLGAEVLDEKQIVAALEREVEISEQRKVLVYVHEGVVKAALEQTTRLFFTEGEVKVSSDLEVELRTGDYGLVIDTSEMTRRTRKIRTSLPPISLYGKYDLEEVPRIVKIRNSSTAVMDIAKIAGEYLKKN